MRFDVAKFVAKHKAAIDELESSLATNFDVPAQRLINCAFAHMGEQRFVGKHDRWEQITAWQSGEQYIPVPRHLMDRWARY